MEPCTIDTGEGFPSHFSFSFAWIAVEDDLSVLIVEALDDATRVWRLRDQGGPGCVLTAELAPEFDDAALDGLDIEVTQTAVHRTSRDSTGRWQRFGPMPGVCEDLVWEDFTAGGQSAFSDDGRYAAARVPLTDSPKPGDEVDELSLIDLDACTTTPLPGVEGILSTFDGGDLLAYKSGGLEEDATLTRWDLGTGVAAWETTVDGTLDAPFRCGPHLCIRGGGFGADGLTFMDPANGAVRQHVDFGDLLGDSGGGSLFVNLIDDSPNHETAYVSALFGSGSEDCEDSPFEFGLWRISGFENLEGS